MRKYIPIRIVQLTFMQSVIALCVMLAALSFYILFPFRAGIADGSHTRAQLDQERTQFVARTTELSGLQKRNPADVGPTVTEQVAEEKDYDLPAMMEEILKPEKSKYFEVVNFKTVPQRNVAGMQKTLFFLDIESSYLRVGKFIESLEKSAAVVELRDISFRRSGDDLRKVRASLELEALTEGEEE